MSKVFQIIPFTVSCPQDVLGWVNCSSSLQWLCTWSYPFTTSFFNIMYPIMWIISFNGKKFNFCFRDKCEYQRHLVRVCVWFNKSLTCKLHCAIINAQECNKLVAVTTHLIMLCLNTMHVPHDNCILHKHAHTSVNKQVDIHINEWTPRERSVLR